MGATTALLWIAIVSSTVVLIAYEIWNAIVVSKDFAKMAREARKED